MKKTILLLAAAAIVGTANATILRVNNTSGSGAPYAEISAAINAAEPGDTIMVDGSTTQYGGGYGSAVTIEKKVVLIGPGYWRTENGIMTEGGSEAKVYNLNIKANGTVVRGMTIVNTVSIDAANVVFNRNLVNEIVVHETKGDKAIIHQNFIQGGVTGRNYTQITNNIITYVPGYAGAAIYRVNEGIIAYNTFATKRGDTSNGYISENVKNTTIKNNIFMSEEEQHETCTFVDNFWTTETLYSKTETDKQIKETKISSDFTEQIAGKGAFEGDDPYVISGIPTGPMIEGITVPASVEQGNTLNVTIKLGIKR